MKLNLIFLAKLREKRELLEILNLGECLKEQYDIMLLVSNVLFNSHWILKIPMDNSKKDQLLQQAINAFKQDKLRTAYRILNKLDPKKLKNYSNAAHVYFYLARIAQKENQLKLAAFNYRLALKRKPHYLTALNNLGNVLKNLDQDTEAKQCFEKALSIDQRYSEAYYNYGNLLVKLDDPEGASQHFEKAIHSKPHFFQAYYPLIAILIHKGDIHKAETFQQQFHTLELPNPDDFFRCGVLFHEKNYIRQATSSYHKAMEAGSQQSDVRVNLALAYFMLGESRNRVIEIFQKAIEKDPNNSSIYVNFGFALYRYQEFARAKEMLDKAISINPNLPEAYYNLGMIAHDQKQYDKAMVAFHKALGRRTDYLSAQVMLINAAQHCADWKTMETTLSQFIEQADDKRKRQLPVSVSPFATLMLPISNKLQFYIAQSTAKDYKPSLPSPFIHKKSTERPLRIGYLSADFTTRHPVGLLISNIFSYHDPKQFITYAYGIRRFPAHESEHIEKSFHHFCPIDQMNDAQAAQRIYDDGIDILIDLGGHTKHARPGILVNRPAPIQCHYLGMTNSMGASYVDYYLATETMVNDQLRSFFTEKIVYLPKTFIAAPPFDIPNNTISRADYGLKEEACVFCCFNTVQRIDKTVFDSWMRILSKVENSVLWLQDENETMKRNLRDYASQQQINPDRLIFTPPEALTKNWRHRLADCWLDTFIVSAGTAGLICAYAGLPLLTLCGQTPHSRTGASVVRSAGTPELIVNSIQEYENKAIELGNDRNQLSALRQKLLSNRDTSPLFNPKSYIADLEQAYQVMYDHYPRFGS